MFPEALCDLWQCVDPARADSSIQPILAELHTKLFPHRCQGVQASTVKLVPKASLAPAPLPKKRPKASLAPAGVHASRSPKTSTLPQLLTKLYSLVFACSDFADSELALLVFDRSDLLET